MLKHIVCFKLKEGESAQKAKDVLLSMHGKVPILRDIEVGIDELHSSRSYDVILSVLLDNMESLDLYQNDPYHVGVVKKYIHAVAQSSIALDYTI